MAAPREASQSEMAELLVKQQELKDNIARLEVDHRIAFTTMKHREKRLTDQPQEIRPEISPRIIRDLMVAVRAVRRLQDQIDESRVTLAALEGWMQVLQELEQSAF
jgi:hypothetical protein